MPLDSIARLNKRFAFAVSSLCQCRIDNSSQHRRQRLHRACRRLVSTIETRARLCRRRAYTVAKLDVAVGVARSCGPPVPTDGLSDVPLSTSSDVIGIAQGTGSVFITALDCPAQKTKRIRCVAPYENTAVCVTDSVINGNRQLSHGWSVSRGYALPQACNNAVPVWLPCLSHYRTLFSRFITA